ncbi:MAG: tyrosine-type recombinase/integrase [Pseudobdellovibrionaceae bacterium]|nr:tyrosine-type recombinase/integrase [Pseudobdellovibrionaceae bacterium]
MDELWTPASAIERCPPLDTGDIEKILRSFFLNHRSRLTAKAYLTAAREFFALFRDEVNAPADLRRHHVIAYKSWLESRRQAPKTILKKLSGVSSLCRFLAEAGLLDRDITYGVSRPEAQNQRETGDLPDEDVRRLLAAIDPKSYAAASHRAILSVLFHNGPRSREVRELRIKDQGTVRGIRVLRFHIKGDRLHEQPLHPVAITAIEEHLAVLRQRGFQIDDPGHVLFPSLKTGRNVPMSDEAIRYIFKTALARAGIGQDSFRRYSPHSGRATFTGHLLDTVGAPLEDVQAALGHRNSRTTQGYNKRKKAHEKSVVFRVGY